MGPTTAPVMTTALIASGVAVVVAVAAVIAVAIVVAEVASKTHEKCAEWTSVEEPTERTRGTGVFVGVDIGSLLRQRLKI